MKIVLLVLAFLGLHDDALAASNHDWASVSHSRVIAIGQRIQVGTVDKRKVRGELTSVDEDGLVLTTGGGSQRVPRASVSVIWVEKRAHRLRNALIGFVGGGGVSYLIGYAGCQGLKLDCIGRVAVGTVAGIGIGTVTGAALPGGWREVYRAT